MSRLLLFSLLAVVVARVAANGHDVGQPATFDCTQDGFFADHGRNCVVYYRCANGDMTAFGCNKGHLFDETSSKCLPADSVTC
ncbi:putative Chitin binding Peritrophin-A domain-containing protein 16 [Homarus americanus]|uniref:Putative Chitin binding Peritrophin-A domain-containing protein 16 n=1 Tax=Homarus americanus TaxID=6706 RepID=A0A8J5KCH2_HOMAM|nr:putative Chitin binding Peritrophin-A domain-containing protein 16 [Homarus americanus]